MTGINHAVVVVVVVPELLRDSQRFAHAHDGQLASRQQPDDGRSLGVDLLEIRQIAAFHIPNRGSVQ